MQLFSRQTKPALGGWLKLRHAPGLGPASIRNLLSTFATADEIINTSPQHLRQLSLSEQTIGFLTSDHLSDAIQRELEWNQVSGQTIISLHDPRYPEQLKNITNPPIVLYIKGDTRLLSDPQLAMVGSRNPTAVGEQNAYEFAKHLATAGLIITSGLAQGIDAASHKGAMAANRPTLAIMATGLDKIYPASHQPLANEILHKQGALVSEFPLGTPPRAEHFPQRNRIISGLSLGTLVIEAALRSGSLITARHASEQGREVFALPGSIHNPLARGCHQLIRQGAKLVDCSQDILEELAPYLKASLKESWATAADNKNDSIGLSLEYQQFLQTIGYDPVTIDELVDRSGMAVDVISSMLLILELKGFIAGNRDGRYVRLNTPS